VAGAELQQDRIVVLPAAVADGIAAGEVIDRPAAVVKELVENSIDAGARRIDVRVREAGQGLIEVVDDGRGIRATELPVAFRRHATSKIRSLEDMRVVRTLGFRGEALASIAAVSRVEAVSRARDGEEEGQRVVVEAGSLLHAGAHGGPAGSRLSVTKLFFNTPARLKFLKQPATENAVIIRLLTEMALAHPAVAVSLDVDGRHVLETHGEGDLRATFAAIHDAAMAAAMLEVDAPLVRGLISPPAMHRPTRDHLIILVNGRRIQHRNLAFALEQAYRGLREPDRFPLAVLDLRVDPSEVDVNVHPTKREVRFRNEGTIFAAIERACYHALRSSPLYELHRDAGGAGLSLRESGTLWLSTSVTSRSATGGRPSGAEESPQLPPLRYVGQLLDGYLVAEAPEAAVLIDQHAAHERVLFDRIMERLEERRPSSQMFLIAHVVDMTAPQAAAFEQHEAWLRTIGFEGEGFGPERVRLSAAPAELPESRINTVLTHVLDDLGAERSPDRRLRETAALIACHSAIRFGDPIRPEAAAQLLSSLAETANPISCPHGRPTTLILPDSQLRHLFKRP